MEKKISVEITLTEHAYVGIKFNINIDGTTIVFQQRIYLSDSTEEKWAGLDFDESKELCDTIKYYEQALAHIIGETQHIDADGRIILTAVEEILKKLENFADTQEI